jgi:hypothetical protein
MVNKILRHIFQCLNWSRTQNFITAPAPAKSFSSLGLRLWLRNIGENYVFGGANETLKVTPKIKKNISKGNTEFYPNSFHLSKVLNTEEQGDFRVGRSMFPKGGSSGGLRMANKRGLNQ